MKKLIVTDYLKAPGQVIPTAKEGGIAAFLVRIINFLSLIIGSVAFVAIVVGGIFLVTSAGNEQNLTKGKDIIMYAVIGLVVALSAYFITSFVQGLFYEEI